MTTELLTTQELHDEIEQNFDLIAVLAYADNCHLKLEEFEDWRVQFEDSFVGRYNTFKEYAEEMADELGESTSTRYFDYDAFARDLGYDYWESTDSENYDTLIFRM